MTEQELIKYKDFDEIDKKMAFIKANKGNFESEILDLNGLQDVEFVKESERIELNSSMFKGIPMGPNITVAKVSSSFIANRAKHEKLLSKISDKYNVDTLVFYKEENGSKIEIKQCKIPAHLASLSWALKHANIDGDRIKKGVDVPLESEFIEHINELIFSDNKQFQAGGISIPTAGYGFYRRPVFRYGSYDEMNVRIDGANFEPTPGEFVRADMDALLKQFNGAKDIHPIVKAILFKTKFIHIHPFSDGNGRTSRILLNYMLVRNGYPIVIINGDKANRNHYLDIMNKAICGNDFSGLLSLVKELINERCDEYIAIIKENSKDSQVSTTAQDKVTEIFNDVTTTV